jgi:hypothetical protein
MDETATIVDAELLDVQAPPPSEKTPSNTREFFLRPPDWRYQEASKYLNEERDGFVPSIPSDVFVQFAVRGIRAMRSPRTRDVLLAKNYNLAAALYCGVTARHSSLVAEMEALIIGGYTRDTLSKATTRINKDIFELYRRIFFDLTGITAMHSWINHFLFEPERYAESPILLRSRLLAYYSSVQDGVDAANMQPLSKEARDCMQSIMENERHKKIFDYVVKVAHLEPEKYAEIMEAAIKSASDRAFVERMKEREESGSASLEELATGLEEGIRAFSLDELEASKQDKIGLDFDNKYISAILRKDQ